MAWTFSQIILEYLEASYVDSCKCVQMYVGSFGIQSLADLAPDGV